MRVLCADCPNTYEHYEHQRCYGCGARVPVPKRVTTFTNSTLCGKCHDERYTKDEDGNLIIKVKYP